MDEKLAMRITEAADAIDVSRSKAYELVASGEIPSIRIGKSLRVPVAGLKEYVRQKTEQAAARG